MPLGFLAALAVLRTRAGRPACVRRGAARHRGRRRDRLRHGDAAELPAVARSLQRRLRPEQRRRAGRRRAGGGAGAAGRRRRTGAALARHWFVEESRGALVLLALWPFALLFPAAVTFGLGQVFERLEDGDRRSGCSTRPSSTGCRCASSNCEPLVPGVELLCVMLGALVPCLLAFLVTRSIARRAVLLPLALAGRAWRPRPCRRR